MISMVLMGFMFYLSFGVFYAFIFSETNAFKKIDVFYRNRVLLTLSFFWPIAIIIMVSVVIYECSKFVLAKLSCLIYSLYNKNSEK